jgi:hypothetical protein
MSLCSAVSCTALVCVSCTAHTEGEHIRDARSSKWCHASTTSRPAFSPHRPPTRSCRYVTDLNLPIGLHHFDLYYLWISKIELWISIIQFWISVIELLISTIQFWISVIQLWIAKIEFWISKIELRISLIQLRISIIQLRISIINKF